MTARPHPDGSVRQPCSLQGVARGAKVRVAAALFSLGNFAGYGECRGMLEDPALGLEEVLAAAAVRGVPCVSFAERV